MVSHHTMLSKSCPWSASASHQNLASDPHGAIDFVLSSCSAVAWQTRISRPCSLKFRHWPWSWSESRFLDVNTIPRAHWLCFPCVLIRWMSSLEIHVPNPEVVSQRFSHVLSDYSVEFFEPHCFFFRPLTARCFLSILAPFHCTPISPPVSLPDMYSDISSFCPGPVLPELSAARKLLIHTCCAPVGLFLFFYPRVCTAECCWPCRTSCCCGLASLTAAALILWFLV